MNKIDLNGRKAVITGGARGIGFAITERLLESGASCSLWDRDPARLDEAAKKLSGANKVHAVAVDVPALRTHRLTLTYPALLAAHQVFFLVTGAEKASPLADILRPKSALPAARIAQRPGPVTIFCDTSAAAALDPGTRTLREAT